MKMPPKVYFVEASDVGEVKIAPKPMT